MNGALDVIVKTLLRSRFERLLNKTDHLTGNGDARFGARPSSEEKDDVLRTTRHNSSQEPRSNVLHRWHRKPSFMEILNKIGDQMAIKNGYRGALCVESSPIRTRKIHQILQ